MNQKTILLAITILLTSSCFLVDSSLNAQELSLHQGFWSMKFYEDNNQISKKEFEGKMNSHPEASKLWSSYKSNNVGASIFAFAGGIGLGRWLTLDRGESKGPWIGLAVGGTVIGAIFATTASNKRRDALFAYNSQFDSSKIRVTPSKSGIGIAVHF